MLFSAQSSILGGHPGSQIALTANVVLTNRWQSLLSMQRCPCPEQPRRVGSSVVRINLAGTDAAPNGHSIHVCTMTVHLRGCMCITHTDIHMVSSCLNSMHRGIEASGHGLCRLVVCTTYRARVGRNNRAMQPTMHRQQGRGEGHIYPRRANMPSRTTYRTHKYLAARKDKSVQV